MIPILAIFAVKEKPRFSEAENDKKENLLGAQD